MLTLAVAAALISSAGLITRASPGDKPPELNCHIGEVGKTYGGSEWIVSSCEDERSLVFVSAPGNPAMPYVFFLFPKNDGYRLYGEGTGHRATTDAAAIAIGKLTLAQIQALIAETKAVAGGSRP